MSGIQEKILNFCLKNISIFFQVRQSPFFMKRFVLESTLNPNLKKKVQLEQQLEQQLD